MTAADRIFVRIAAYREFDLVDTLRDMLALASEPDRLRICICWQHAPDESLEEFASDPRFDVIDVDHMESQGMCWARNLIQNRWDGEPYTLGIDGHHRFVPNWDRILVEQIAGLQAQDVAKPIIGGYAPAFDPVNDPAGRIREVWLTGFDRFEERGVLFIRPYLPEGPIEGPVPARFWSGHFNFTVGEWNAEVPTDPSAYFHSEEIVMTVRSFTHGYDLFNPGRTVLWHEYSRAARVCHWDEHANWTEMSDAAIADYKRLFGVDGEGPDPDYAYGFGTERSLRDYERYAGVDFAARGAQRYTIEHGLPPNPEVAEADWADSLVSVFANSVRVPRRLLDRGCDFWSVFAHTAAGEELFRQDYDQAELEAVLDAQMGPLVDLDIRVAAREKPATWSVWPHSAKGGWLESTEHSWVSR